MKVQLIGACLAAVVALALTPAAYAAPIVYELESHPGGNKNPPPYGVRFDEIFDVTGGHDVWTMDFSHPSSNMTMVLNPADPANGGNPSIHIFGTTYGGLDIGAAYDPTLQGLWTLDFLYTSNVVINGTEWVVNPEDQANNQGSLTPLFSAGPIVAGTPVSLYDEDGGKGFSFKFNDAGHRGGYPYSGWGWMNHDGDGNPTGDPDTHIKSTDWLFIAHPVPEPASMTLLAAGVGVVSFVRRRRNRLS